MTKPGSLESKRWWIAGAAVLMQLCLGTVYAWSVFKNPLMKAHGWNEASVQVSFMICIGSIGLAAAFGGTLVDKKGPRFVATLGGLLFGIGTLIAGFADRIGNIWFLYLGFGLIGGMGSGLAYITPIATLIRWFPDKRGLVTGLAVMGFGAGAFFMGKIAPGMINSLGIADTFFIWGAIFLLVLPVASRFYRNPDKGWIPTGFTPATQSLTVAGSYSFSEAFKSRQWWMLWSILLLNITAGVGFISQLSPMAQEVIRKSSPSVGTAGLAVAGGAIVAYASLFNGLGRLLWAWLSDGLGRKAVFLIMLSTEILLFIFLPGVKSQGLFTLMACYLLACYGGGFAVMPAFAADSFGSGHIGKVYGTMLTAWGVAGVAGPLIFAVVKEAALGVAAGMLLLGFLLTLLYTPPIRKLK